MHGWQPKFQLGLGLMTDEDCIVFVEYEYDVPFSVCEEDLESPHDVEAAHDNSTLRVVCPPGLQ